MERRLRTVNFHTYLMMTLFNFFRRESMDLRIVDPRNLLNRIMKQVTETVDEAGILICKYAYKFNDNLIIYLFTTKY